MPTLPTRSFTSIVQLTIAGIQGRAAALINFSQGSALRAIVEGFAGLFLWFEAMMLQLLMAIRLSTSTGIDVDTFTADFMPPVAGTSSPRLGAQAASGIATFTRLTAGPVQALIPVGSEVGTLDGLQKFTVYADATYATYNAALGAYVLQPAVGSILVPVIAEVPGAAGNIAAGTLTVLRSVVTGIDDVTNNAAFTNGADFESDAALKKRFSDWILGLSRGDLYGTTAAIEGTEVEVQWTYTEGYNLDGSYRPGYYLIVVDDGSGAPSPSLLQTVQNAANAVRPLGVQLGVFAPTLIWATVAMQITTAPGFDHNTVVAAVAALVATNIDSLGLGNDLEFTQLCGWPYAVNGVTKVTGVTINGVTGDIASLETGRLTQDGLNEIAYATVKCQSAVVS